MLLVYQLITAGIWQERYNFGCDSKEPSMAFLDERSSEYGGALHLPYRCGADGQ